MKSRAILIIILALSLFLRTYRTQDFLGFWFDQGRDAKLVWDLLYGTHKPFLVGPTTGIEGIFLGPFYYYLITPFYWLGHGDPVYPVLALGVITTASVYLIYRIGREYFDTPTGLLAAFLYGFSFHIVSYNRWLSNPTALPLFALFVFWMLLKIIHGHSSQLSWAVFGLSLGLSLQLEAASAVFFLPVSVIILFINRKSYALNRRHLFIGLSLFALTLVPQVAFNIRHQNILLKSFQNFLITENSFRPALTDLLVSRLQFYYEIFTNKWYFTRPSAMAFISVTPILAVLARHSLKSKTTAAGVIWWLTPGLILLFYHGNRGYVWDYYFTGVYPILTLLISTVWLTAYRRFRLAKLAVLILLTLFISQNSRSFLAHYTQALPGFISLTPVIQAVDWIYQESAGTPFNTDVYVPPIISHAYDYVFLWRGTTVYHTQPSAPLVTRLYTILEPDYTHPQLRDGWIVRQSRISSIEKELYFGPILVQRRHRFSTNPQ